jgi:hypothetical protein
MGYNDRVEFSTLVGKTLRFVVHVVQEGPDQLRFTTEDGEVYLMFHDQDCCESVGIEDINGDLSDLVGFPVLMAEERVGERPVDRPLEPNSYVDSETWTFYRISTIRGTVVIRWHGESNGYYSEGVSFEKIKENSND